MAAYTPCLIFLAFCWETLTAEPEASRLSGGRQIGTPLGGIFRGSPPLSDYACLQTTHAFFWVPFLGRETGPDRCRRTARQSSPKRPQALAIRLKLSLPGPPPLSAGWSYFTRSH